MTFNEKMDQVMREAGGLMSAREMTDELIRRGWMPELHSVIDIADLMKERYSPEVTL